MLTVLNIINYYPLLFKVPNFFSILRSKYGAITGNSKKLVAVYITT